MDGHLKYGLLMGLYSSALLAMPITVLASIVPEAKNMTDEEAAALLRLALTSEPAREYLKKRAESGNAE